MELNEGIELLTRMFKGRDWFYDVGTDQYGRIVVYTNFMCQETLLDIPDKMAGRQVLVHFATSKLATREQYTNPGRPAPFSAPPKPVLELVIEPDEPDEPFDVIELDASDLENDVDDLCKELDKIERQVGSNIMQDIFYEIHDGKNAVTNLSAKYPEARSSMEKLYNEYGFDVIYEEIPG